MARPRGAKDKVKRTTAASKQAIEAIAVVRGLTPLRVMLEDMETKYHAGDLSGAATRAETCAPYVHARLASATITHRDALDDLSVDDLRNLLASAERAAWVIGGEDTGEISSEGAGKPH